MRTIRPLLAGLLLLATLPALATASVTLYRDVAFRGESETFDTDVPDMRRTRIGNDQASSARVRPGCVATLFRDVDYRGAFFELRGEEADMRRSPIGNDQVSSLRLRCDGGGDWGGSGRGVTLFRGTNYGGESETFGRDVPDLGRTRVGNDAARSIRVPDGCRAEIFADASFRGESVVLFKDLHDLGRTRIGNDRASSLRVSCDGGGSGGSGGSGGGSYGARVTLYRDADFRGGSETFDRDISDMRRTAIGNDALSSMRVPRECQVEIYEDVDYRGRSMRVSSDIRDFRNTPLGNDSASSMRIRCDGGGDWGGGGGDWGSGGGWGGDSSNGVTLYRDAGFRGESETFYSDVPDLRRTRIGNDALSSIRIPRDCRVEIYEDVDYRGRSFQLYDDVSDLSRSPIGNDSASSLRIDCR